MTAGVASVTACVCTHNRADLLRRLCEALARIEPPAGLRFDVLIVDNASTDATAAVARSWCESHPQRFRCVVEERLGLSFARNRGLRETDAEVVAFLDDDALPREGWLPGLVDGYRVGPRVAAVGGQTLLALPEGRLPSWFGKPLYRQFSHREEPGDRMVECRGPSMYPFGANLSFRRALALESGGFHSALGRIGGQLLSGEETVLCEALRRAGFRVLLNPKSIVDHHVPRDRITLRRLFRLAWADGLVCFVWSSQDFSRLGAGQALRAAARCVKTYWRRYRAKRWEKPALVMLGCDFVTDLSVLYHRWTGELTEAAKLRLHKA